MSSRTIEIDKGNPTCAEVHSNISKIYVTYQSDSLSLIVIIIKGEIEAKIPANELPCSETNSLFGGLYCCYKNN